MSTTAKRIDTILINFILYSLCLVAAPEHFGLHFEPQAALQAAVGFIASGAYANNKEYHSFMLGVNLIPMGNVVSFIILPVRHEFNSFYFLSHVSLYNLYARPLVLHTNFIGR